MQLNERGLGEASCGDLYANHSTLTYDNIELYSVQKSSSAQKYLHICESFCPGLFTMANSNSHVENAVCTNHASTSSMRLSHGASVRVTWLAYIAIILTTTCEVFVHYLCQR